MYLEKSIELDAAIKEFALDIWHLALDEGYGSPDNRARLVTNREDEFKQQVAKIFVN